MTNRLDRLEAAGHIGDAPIPTTAAACSSC